MTGCNGCSTDAVELAERNARATAEVTNLSYDEALAQELAAYTAPMEPLDATGNVRSES